MLSRADMFRFAEDKVESAWVLIRPSIGEVGMKKLQTTLQRHCSIYLDCIV